MPMFDPKKIATVILSRKFGTDDRAAELRSQTEKNLERMGEENQSSADEQARTAAAESILRAISNQSASALVSSLETLVRMINLTPDEEEEE